MRNVPEGPRRDRESSKTTYEARGGYDADARVDKALNGLGLAHIGRDRRLGCQDMLSIACTAYYAITGQEGPEGELGSPLPRDPGEPWDFNDPAELQRRYPRLWTCLGYDKLPHVNV